MRKDACYVVDHVILVGLIIIPWLTSCVHTRKFRDEQGRAIAGSIATMEAVNINGVSQSIWFRSLNTKDPALIILSGGPGINESALFRHYNSALERHSLSGWVAQLGGTFYGNLSKEDLIWAALSTDEANLIDLIKFGRGNRFSLDASLG